MREHLPPQKQSLMKAALRDYEPRVAKYTHQLLDNVEKSIGQPIDMSRWFNFYSFDVMGDLAFGESFGMLIDGREGFFLEKLHKDMEAVGLFTHMSWIFPFLTRTPLLNSDFVKFHGWIDQRIEKRMKVSCSENSGPGKGSYL